MEICLSKLKWFNSKNIWVTGFIRSGSKYLTEYELLKYFSGIDTISKFEKILKEANGQFSVIIDKTTEIWASTDRLRNYPLFYSFIGGDFIISDDCYELTAKLSKKSFNPLAVDSFLAAGYTVNNLTLIEDVFQVEAGEYIRSGHSFTRKFYYDSASYPLINKEFDSAAEELNALFSLVFKNHFEALKDKFIIIPLSGGYDSRLIAAMCARYHPDDVLCYTYGTKDNLEVAPAKEIAKRLGFRWINIVYDSELIDGYLNDKCFEDYYHYVSGLSSMFFMQEYFAVKYLKDKKLIPDNSVFMPGFCGDVLSGCNLFPGLKGALSGRHLAKVIFNEFFRLARLKKMSQDQIIKLICKKMPLSTGHAWKVFESWDHKEPKSKFNVNSAKVYPYFRYDYVLPLWDSQLVDFFSALPFEYKLSKRLYDHVLKQYIFKEHDINFSRELNVLPLQKSLQRLKERFKEYVPDMIRNRLVKYYSPVFYDEITKIMIADIPQELLIQPLQPNYYNSYITQWYIIKIKELLELS